MKNRPVEIRKYAALAVIALAPFCFLAAAAQTPQGDPKDTEQWEPVPPIVTPGANPGAPPSDAIVLFDGRNLDQWVNTKDHAPAGWKFGHGLMRVDKSVGNIETKQLFKNYQLHLEWLVPKGITGEGQLRGNSGVFLASTAAGDGGYEVQILDSWKNETAPVFTSDGTLKTPAYVTVFHNGVLVQNHFQLTGETRYIGQPAYQPYDRAAIKLQAHGDPSAPISFRNIWVRELN
jgi:Domain of Unknown Function (DUF1080)